MPFKLTYFQSMIMQITTGWQPWTTFARMMFCSMKFKKQKYLVLGMWYFVWSNFAWPFLPRCKNIRVRRLGYTCTVWWLIAITCWVSDRVFCDTWTHLSFPYLHCVWHVFIFIASYIGCVLGAYFHAASEFAQLRPHLTFWPHWSYDLGIPYITLNGSPEKDTDA